MIGGALKVFSFRSVSSFSFIPFGSLFLWMASMGVVVSIFALGAFLCLLVVLLPDGSYGSFSSVVVLGFLVHHLYGWVLLALYLLFLFLRCCCLVWGGCFVTFWGWF